MPIDLMVVILAVWPQFLLFSVVVYRAISYYLVDGDRFRGLRDNDWKI